MAEPISAAKIEAIEEAARLGGQYIEGAMSGNTDMGSWNRGQWMTFIEEICTGYERKLREIGDKDVPF